MTMLANNAENTAYYLIKRVVICSAQYTSEGHLHVTAHVNADTQASCSWIPRAIPYRVPFIAQNDWAFRNLLAETVTVVN